MFPTLSLGSISLPTYPFFFLLAFWGGLWLAAFQARRWGLDGDHIYNAGLYAFLGGIIGARLWFVLSHWQNYASNLTQALSLSRSALSLGAGLIVGALIVWIYLQRNRLATGAYLDAFAPGLALALVIGHVGAFLGGEGLGATAAVPWAVEIAGTGRHPVQLYEALGSLIILAGLYFNRFRPWPGFQFWLLVALYGLVRLLLEIFRARPVLMGNGYLLVQVVALAAVIVALSIMAYNFSRSSIGINSRGL
jgi:phosphatidylglycerol:prolipoprotein diacylglycerol transferase